MRLVTWVLASGLLISTAANAQMSTEQACGKDANEQFSETVKGNLDAKAQTLAKLGSAELKGAGEKTTNEIMINPNRSDAARQLFYLKRVSCILIYEDPSLLREEKVKRIEALGTLKVSQEIDWITRPPVRAEMTDSQAKSLLEAGKTASVGARGCFSPPDTPPAEREMGNWRFMPETASPVEDQHSCNSGQANIGGMGIVERSPTNLCLEVGARPAQQGQYHCTTVAHIRVKIMRPGY